MLRERARRDHAPAIGRREGDGEGWCRFDLADTARPFAQNHGAGYRAIYDLGRPERSVFVISTGQSGNPLSSHYEDYAEPWRDGRYLPMLTDRTAVEEDALGTLVLTPR